MFNKVYYLNHSGFIVEGEKTVLVFDFFSDEAQILSRFENCGKTVTFFVSHRHPDHWNPDIFTFRNTVPSHYFLDQSLTQDVRQLSSLTKSNVHVHFVREDTLLHRDDLLGTGIETLICAASTDEGVAFWLAAEGQCIFHAGDLNDWDWSDEDGPQVEQTYRTILLRLKEKVRQAELPALQIAFVPVDKRLEGKALQGACIFCEYFQAEFLVPMHLNGGNDLPAQLQKATQDGRTQHLNHIKVLSMTEQGQSERLWL